MAVSDTCTSQNMIQAKDNELYMQCLMDNSNYVSNDYAIDQLKPHDYHDLDLNEYVFANVICIDSKYVYKYTDDLFKLDSCRPVNSLSLPERCCKVTTPLKVAVWEQQLHNHPDRNFVRYILEGIRNGFRVGFQYESGKLQPAKANMQSALAKPEVIREYLDKEVKAGRVIGQIEQPIQISRFGLIPKAEADKWRLIVDLSHPLGCSVNDGVSREWSSIRYATIDQAVVAILKRGQGTELAKVDVEQAYRNVPIHKDDRVLLGMEWEGERFMDTTLPFGLRSAPKVFSALADALEWAFINAGVSFSLHFLDDYLTMGRAGTNECARNLETMIGVCDENGTPLKQRKIVGPATSLDFLGILLDTIKLEMRLPEEKMRALKVLIQQWLSKKACKKRELLSLIGKLSHACRIVRPGRIFLRRMIDTSCKVKQLDQWIRLNVGFRSDLAWWGSFLQVWNGKSFMQVYGQGATPNVTFASDASGGWGCGAVWGTQWLQGQWGDSWEQVNIAIKELVPVVVSCAVWGPQWAGKLVLNLCDNMAVVDVVKTQRSKDPTIMHLLRCLHFICAYWEVELRVEHIPGNMNVIADAISRNMPQVMKEAGLEEVPVQIPEELWRLLVIERPDWLQPTWRSLLTTSLHKVLPQVPGRHMQ